MFSDDLELARAWIQQQMRGAARDQGQLAHWALSLGLTEVVAARLSDGAQGLSTEQQRGLAFRITRKAGASKTHQQLFTALALESLQQRWEKLSEGKDRIAIALHGGIGDYLQDISTLMNLLRIKKHRLRLHLAPERMAQFRRVLALNGEHLQISDQALLLSEGLHVVELMALLGSETLLPQTWLQPPRPRTRNYQLLCCWRAQGQKDPFSSWSRSVPFTAVQELYQALVSSGLGPHTIVDITAWKPWETAALRQLGVHLVDPADGDVLDLAELVHSCSQVISIDTALVHLCAAMGDSVHLLLPKFYDERWVELLQSGSSYAHCCKVWRQEEFGCWKAPLQQLKALVSQPGGPD